MSTRLSFVDFYSVRLLLFWAFVLFFFSFLRKSALSIFNSACLLECISLSFLSFYFYSYILLLPFLSLSHFLPQSLFFWLTSPTSIERCLFSAPHFHALLFKWCYRWYLSLCLSPSAFDLHRFLSHTLSNTQFYDLTHTHTYTMFVWS